MTIKYKLLSKISYVWDVIATFIDNTQARLWYKLEEKRWSLYYEINSLKDSKDLEDYDSFEEVK